jgi:acetolactate synthase I/II/III large subunit
MKGSERLCRALEELSVDTVFGLPGSQNVALFDALRTSRIRTVVATNELAAAFMANGYARASGRPGVLVTIPGPGFTYSLTGLAEAYLDSTPLLHILGQPPSAPDRRFQLQALDQRSILAPLVKQVLDVPKADRIEEILVEAHVLCTAGEPGPVVVHVPVDLAAEAGAPKPVPLPPPAPATASLRDLERRLAEARRPLFYVGQGAAGAAGELRALVEALRIPIVTTTSARGILSEDHPWVIPFDRGSSDALNELVASCDLVLALGCKFSHNGAHGFRLKLPKERLIHIDSSADVLGANYAASMTLLADAPWLVRTLLEHQSAPSGRIASAWTEEQIATWKRRAFERYHTNWEPKVRALEPPTIEEFFAALRRAMPDESCLVLDSGLHQMLARRHFRARSPRSFLLPTDLQAMGFALPAAIGARIARPERPVVALLGDGGFAISGLELLTAVRERVRLTVIVFNDGHFGLIRKQQLGATRHTYGTELHNPDFRQVAEAAGARYVRTGDDAEESLHRAVASHGVTLVEVVLRDPGRERIKRVRRSLGASLARWIPGRR